jgi:peptidoglycan/xylan/chitin deacetylase (PgdA/CDA1 family)
MRLRRNLYPAVLTLLLALAGCYSIGAAARDTPRGVVTFSFDDGPNGRVTPRLLETLERHGVRGTFALLGVNAEKYPALVRRIAAGGHGLINHGYGEQFAVFLDRDAFLANLDAGQRAIDAALGETPDTAPPDTARRGEPFPYRPQGGFYSRAQQRLWEARGCVLAPVNIRVYDAVLSEKDRDKVVREVIQKVEKLGGGVVLLHDGKDAWTTKEAGLERNPRGPYNRDWIPGAVEELILVLREKGYDVSGGNP